MALIFIHNMRANAAKNLVTTYERLSTKVLYITITTLLSVATNVGPLSSIALFGMPNNTQLSSSWAIVCASCATFIPETCLIIWLDLKKLGCEVIKRKRHVPLVFHRF